MSDDFDDPGTGTPTTLPGGFRAAVSEQLAALGYRVAAWQSDGMDVVGPDGKEHSIGLSNLYRRAKATDRPEWPRMIREFLNHLTQVDPERDVPDNLATVIDQLRPRVGRPFGRERTIRPWALPLSGTDLEIHLVIDREHTMTYVTEEMFKTTATPAEDLLDAAVENLRQATPDDFLERVSDEIDIHIGHTGDGYDAARCLLVEELMPENAAGFWVAVPSREELVVWPVSLVALRQVHVIKMYTQDSFKKHAYPISDEVYWVRDGEWFPFGIRLEGNTLAIDAPEPFAEVMEQLGAEPDEDEPPP
jgi:hypothetical protein